MGKAWSKCQTQQEMPKQQRAEGDGAPPEAEGDAKRQRAEAGQPHETGDGAPTAPPPSEEREDAAFASFLPPPAKIKFSLATLEAEVEALRAEPPAFVHEVGRLSVPSLTVTADGELVKPTVGEGPWDLTLIISGREGDKAFGHPFNVIMRFSTSYPLAPPWIRFQGTIHHALLDDNELYAPFYARAPKDPHSKAHSLRLMVKALHDFLCDPLKAMGVDPEKMGQRGLSALMMNEDMNTQRWDVIGKYRQMCKHPELFETSPTFRDEWLDPAFREARRAGTPEGWRAILREELPGEVFSFPCFTLDFCQLLVEEIFGFYASGLPARRPNSMNNYGIILNEIGMEPFIQEYQRMLQPIGELLYPGAGEVWDGNHCFIVRYREGEDLGLDMHTDDSDVTFNICLGLEFDGAGLPFCGMMGAANHRKHTYTYQHVKGRCVVHLGRKRHGADDITSGERLNIILWNHSSTYRSSMEYRQPDYQKEDGPPDSICVSYTHDRDYGNFKSYTEKTSQFEGRGWCPPTQFAYEGFKPDAVEKGRGG